MNKDKNDVSDIDITLSDIAMLRTIASEATQEQWYYGATPCQDKATAMGIFEKTVDATKVTVDNFFEIFVEDGRRVSFTGNGPTSEANSLHISTFSPPNVLLSLSTLERLMVANNEHS